MMLIHADARSIPLADESVDCVVTSPPYWGLRDYRQDGQIGLEPTPAAYVENMLAVFREVRRVLKPAGTLWLNLGDSYSGQPRQDQGFNQRWHGKHYLSDKQGETARTRPKRQGTLKPKDLVGIPWRVAFALQDDGWYLRSDIIWAKPNPMPESVTDRPTKAHEYIFLLTKQARYFFDAEAVREPVNPSQIGRTRRDVVGGSSHAERQQHSKGGVYEKGTTRNSGREKDPIGLKATLHERWMESISKSKRHPILERGRDADPTTKSRKHGCAMADQGEPRSGTRGGIESGTPLSQGAEVARRDESDHRNIRTVWTIATQPYPGAHYSTFPEALVKRCVLAGCPSGGAVLDPFVGSGTVVRVARSLGREGIGLDLNESYLTEQAAKRVRTTQGFAF